MVGLTTGPHGTYNLLRYLFGAVKLEDTAELPLEPRGERRGRRSLHVGTQGIKSKYEISQCHVNGATKNKSKSNPSKSVIYFR